MTEGTGQALDPSHEARSVLRAAVADYGTSVLSNTAIIEGICEDRLPEWPREASLVGIAARADVAAMLTQQAGVVGPDAAVKATAATLADSRALDPGACVWVVSEFARALGYQVSAGLQPADGATGRRSHSPTERAGFGDRETETAAPGHGENEAAGPNSGDAKKGVRPHEARRPRQRVLAVSAVAALLLVYFIVAGGAHLPPFGTTPISLRTRPPHPTASVTTFHPTAGDKTLAALIPGDVSAGGSCSPVHRPFFGSTAEMHCTGAPNIPTAYVQYYLFSNSMALKDAYSQFLSDFAHTGKNSGRCHRVTGTAAFSSFAPCETVYSFGNTPEGRITEYYYKGTPDISCTFTTDLVLIDMQGSDHSAMIAWWDHSQNWLVTKNG